MYNYIKCYFGLTSRSQLNGIDDCSCRLLSVLAYFHIVIGELPDGEHLQFWLSILRTAKLMSDWDGTSPGAEETLRLAEDLSDVIQNCTDLYFDDSPDAARLLQGPLLVIR